MCLFFFFKQKTAYEMRISDWSSDVCSSDLSRHHWASADAFVVTPSRSERSGPDAAGGGAGAAKSGPTAQADSISAETVVASRMRMALSPYSAGCGAGSGDPPSRPRSVAMRRSEEHTSELQSLMRNSYAVFCLKKHK